MTTHSPLTRPAWTLAAFLATTCAQAQAPSFPLLKSCGQGAELIANAGSSDPIRIRYSLATDTGNCYAVTATIGGKAVDGYMAVAAHPASGGEHPAIVAFQQEIGTHFREIPAVVPVAPPPPSAPAVSKEAAPETPQPLSFAGFRAIDIDGHRVDFSTLRTPNIVVYFWSASDARAGKKTEAIDNLYGEFHNRGVDVVGIASARNASQLREICRNHEVVWPEILDSGGIASRYHVDPAKPYLLLDQSRRVIAAVASPKELAQILGPLTQRRRVSQ